MTLYITIAYIRGHGHIIPSNHTLARRRPPYKHKLQLRISLINLLNIGLNYLPRTHRAHICGLNKNVIKYVFFGV